MTHIKSLRCMPVLALVAGVLSPTPVLARGFSACSEMYVYVPSAHYGNSGNANHPTFSAPHVELTAHVDVGGKLETYVLGPKIQTTPSHTVRWSAPWAGEARGAWIPVRPGKLLRVRLAEVSDVGGGRSSAGDVFKVPALSSQGRAVVQVQFPRLTVFFSATDGKRWCRGVEAPLEARIPEVGVPVEGLLDDRGWADMESRLQCAAGSASPGCARERYAALYADGNGDGRGDLVAVTEFEREEGVGGVGIWTSVAGDRQFIYGAACRRMGRASPDSLFCVREGGVDQVFPRKLVVQPAAPDYDAFLKKSLQAVVMEELRRMSRAWRVHLAEPGGSAAGARIFEFMPMQPTRYTYYGPTTGHQGQSGEGEHFVVWPARKPGAAVPASFEESGCPVTLGRTPEGEDVGLGVTPSGRAFTGYALGNLDEDPDFDCWSVSSVARVGRDGVTIPAGEPYQEKAD